MSCRLPSQLETIISHFDVSQRKSAETRLDCTQSSQKQEGFRGAAMHICVVCTAECTSRCQRCGVVAYCSKECQKIHWPLHKTKCKPKQKELTSALRGGVRVVLGPTDENAKHLSKDENGQLMKLGQAKLRVLHQAMNAPDGSTEKKQLFKQFRSMAKQEAAGWQDLDEPAGVAKAWYMLAVGNMEMGQKSKFVKYAAKMREVLAGMPEDDEQTQMLHQVMNQQETLFYKHFDVGAYKTRVVHKKANMQEMAHKIPAATLGHGLQLLREKLGTERHLVIVIMLKKKEDPEMLAPAVREAFVNVMQCSELAKAAVDAGFTDRDGISSCYELDGLKRRMLLYANKPEEVINFMRGVQDIGHQVRLYRHDQVEDNLKNDVGAVTLALLMALLKKPVLCARDELDEFVQKVEDLTL